MASHCEIHKSFPRLPAVFLIPLPGLIFHFSLEIKVPTAKAVNGGEVRPRERVEAEKFYIRHCLETSGGKTSAQIASGDGAFAMCLEKHGEPVAKKVGKGEHARSFFPPCIENSFCTLQRSGDVQRMEGFMVWGLRFRVSADNGGLHVEKRFFESTNFGFGLSACRLL